MKRLLTTTAIVAMTAMPLAAQESSGNNQSEVQLGADQMRMSSLMDTSVYMTETGAAPNWDEVQGDSVPDNWIEVGTITDVFLNDDGSIAQVILEPSSEVESDAQQVAVDMSALDFHSSGDGEGPMVMVVYTGDKLSPADSDNGEDMASGDGSGNMAATEGDQVASGDGSGNMAATEGDQMASSGDSGDMATADGEQMAATEMDQSKRDELTAEDLEGQPVYGTNGDRIGEIGQLVLSDDGKIDQVVFDVGGFLGLGEKPVAVAYDEVKIMGDPENDDLRIETNYTEDELKSMDRWQQ